MASLKKEKQLKYLSYLQPNIADKEYEAQRSREEAAEFKYQYHRLHSSYIKLLRWHLDNTQCPHCKAQLATPESLKSATQSSELLSTCSSHAEAITSSTGKASGNKLFTDGESCDQAFSSRLCPQTTIPEVSLKNYEKLLGDYNRLQKLLKEVNEEKLANAEKLMEKEEYEDVIAGLREQLRRAVLEIEEAKFIISAISRKDKSSLIQNYHDLQKKLTVLERGAKCKDDMISQLLEVIKKLRGEQQKNDDEAFCSVDDVDSTPTKNVHLNSEMERRISELENELTVLKVSLTKENEAKLNLEKQYRNLLAIHETLLAQKKLEPEECPESIYQLLAEKRSLQDTVKVLRHDLANTLEDKQLLQEQSTAFLEDHRDLMQEKDMEIEKLKKENASLIQLKKSQRKPFSRGDGEGILPSVRSVPSSIDSGYQSSSLSGCSSMSGQANELICGRCEACFNDNEEQKYNDHLKKCQAD